MSRLFVSVFVCVFFLHLAAGHTQLCGNETHSTRSCTKILGHERADSSACQVEYLPSNSSDCRSMNFGSITSNMKIGGVHLKPVLLPWNGAGYSANYSVLNITFSNIKWKFMKFRFRHSKISYADFRHCSSIRISKDLTVDDQSVLYYDCYWSNIIRKQQAMILEFEATNDRDVYRGEYHFNIPNASMLNTNLNETQWKPFIYVEILTANMMLHILPPSMPLKIKQYRVQVMCDVGENCNGIVKSKIVSLTNNSQDVTFEHSMIGISGAYYFRVTPLHEHCSGEESDCQHIDSPAVNITNELHSNLTIGMASIAAVVAAIVFVYGLCYLYMRRMLQKRTELKYMTAMDKDLTTPRLLVIYPPATQHHARLTKKLVNYLRSKHCMTVMYDGDIINTPHKDPHKWAVDSYEAATHILYIVGPTTGNQAVHPYKDLYKVQLRLLGQNLVNNQKDISNVYFEYSRNADLPLQTMNEKKYHLIKDWIKMISHLTEGMPAVDLIKQSRKDFCPLIMNISKNSEPEFLLTDVIYDS